jgi:hypothetical protein
MIENDKDVDDGFRVKTGNCGAADVLQIDNSSTKDRFQYRGFLLKSRNPGWIILDHFNYARHWRVDPTLLRYGYVMKREAKKRYDPQSCNANLDRLPKLM